MIEEHATVTSIEGSQITVTSEVKSGCDQCSQVNSCANGQVAKALPTKKLSLQLSSEQHVKVGDQVIIGIPEHFLLRSAWQVYLWPLFGLITFAFFGQQLLDQGLLSYEWQSIILAVAGGYCGSKLAKWWQSYSGLAERLSPKLLRVIPQELASTNLK